MSLITNLLSTFINSSNPELERKVELLNQARQASELDDHTPLIDLALKKGYLNDREFLFQFLKIVIKNSPACFYKNMHKFEGTCAQTLTTQEKRELSALYFHAFGPKVIEALDRQQRQGLEDAYMEDLNLNEEDLLKAAHRTGLKALFKNALYLPPFYHLFGVNSQELEEAHHTFVQALKAIETDSTSTIAKCHGYAMTRIAAIKDTKAFEEPQKFARQTLFNQASHSLLLSSVTQDSFKTGSLILKTPDKYPYTLSRAARILGYKESKELLSALSTASNEERTRITTLIGKTALSKQSEQAMASFELINERESSSLTVLTKAEIQNLKKLIPSSTILPHSKLPKRIERNLKIQKSDLAIDSTPLNSLAKALKLFCANPFKNKNGQFVLSLSGKFKGEQIGHAIYLTLNPPSFAHTGNYDLLTLEPKTLETFVSPQEMIDELTKHLAYTYPQGLFTAFELRHFE